jgi:hypothetical protein
MSELIYIQEPHNNDSTLYIKLLGFMQDFLAMKEKILKRINSIRYLHHAILKFALFCNFNILLGRLLNNFIQE